MTTDMEQQEQQQPNLWGVVKKGVSNVKARTVIGSKNTKEAVKIHQASLKIAERKRQFGTEYLNLMLEQGADINARDLEDCLKAALQDIAKLNEKMTRWGERILLNQQKLQQKIHGKKSMETVQEHENEEEDSDNGEPVVEGALEQTLEDGRSVNETDSTASSSGDEEEDDDSSVDSSVAESNNEANATAVTEATAVVTEITAVTDATAECSDDEDNSVEEFYNEEDEEEKDNDEQVEAEAKNNAKRDSTIQESLQVLRQLIQTQQNVEREIAATMHPVSDPRMEPLEGCSVNIADDERPYDEVSVISDVTTDCYNMAVSDDAINVKLSNQSEPDNEHKDETEKELQEEEEEAEMKELGSQSAEPKRAQDDADEEEEEEIVLPPGATEGFLEYLLDDIPEEGESVLSD